jgi:hypothetical protein
MRRHFSKELIHTTKSVRLIEELPGREKGRLRRIPASRLVCGALGVVVYYTA